MQEFEDDSADEMIQPASPVDEADSREPSEAWEEASSEPKSPASPASPASRVSAAHGELPAPQEVDEVQEQREEQESRGSQELPEHVAATSAPDAPALDATQGATAAAETFSPSNVSSEETVFPEREKRRPINPEESAETAETAAPVTAPAPASSVPSLPAVSPQASSPALASKPAKAPTTAKAFHPASPSTSTLRRTRSSPSNTKLGLDVVEAYANLYKTPAWTMRTKTAFGDEQKYRNTGGEAGQDLSSKYDQIRPRAPQFSMVSRSSGIPKPPKQPGPGEYTLPSTLYGSHPALPVPGRVPKTTARRSLPSDGMPVTPSPLDYQVVQEKLFGRVDQSRVPQYTMRSKLVDPSSREVRPGAYDTGNCNHHGPMTTPKWTMVPRSSGMPKPVIQPGPGEYTLPSTLYGSHPALPMAGRVPRSTAERFPSKVEERPY